MRPRPLALIFAAFGLAPLPLAAQTPACAGPWYTARLTNYVSHSRPNSRECRVYKGCEHAGRFYGLAGSRDEDWVARHNIVAVHLKDWDWLGMKTLRLRQNGRTILVSAIDACNDADCDGCCTANLDGAEFLIDIEKYTRRRFGSGEGLVEFQLCD